jgi:hypothetical protein
MRLTPILQIVSNLKIDILFSLSQTKINFSDHSTALVNGANSMQIAAQIR